MGAYPFGLDFPRDSRELADTSRDLEQAKDDDKGRKETWPLWQKLALVGLSILVIAPAAVGMSLGLSHSIHTNPTT
ncbi:hypothetical protein QQX98_002714 [Neonectria punicea]|uniref:Uncharacterized protein n=1 Tax=Neonectria punicea TaxID=979145 RepID=A0ABR1HH57_9HYPO